MCWAGASTELGVHSPRNSPLSMLCDKAFFWGNNDTHTCLLTWNKDPVTNQRMDITKVQLDGGTMSLFGLLPRSRNDSKTTASLKSSLVWVRAHPEYTALPVGDSRWLSESKSLPDNLAGFCFLWAAGHSLSLLCSFSLRIFFGVQLSLVWREISAFIAYFDLVNLVSFRNILMLFWVVYLPA